MFVKSIDLHGFKSFADKTHVEFNEGMTAIVGPNGCGKSNVCDAFRWALGEQRVRALRGTKMQDVIFNGTENRHSLGMAEVTLKIDNTSGVIPVDYREVMVTRRLYRSGDSEYLLNKVPCRLRDIVELFMDTGLSKSAYSVIGQGKMDMVLSSKPEERRFLFEEAAGIVKYKTRQQAAMRRLESAENNLLRLDDVITEVRRRMRSLRRQAGAARRYKEMQETLRQLEIRTAYAVFEELTRTCASLESKLIDRQQQREGHVAGLAAAEADRETMAARLMEAERDLTSGRVSLHDLETRTDRLERHVSVLRERVGSNKQMQERAESDLADINTRAESIANEIETFTCRLGAAETEAGRFAEQLTIRETEGLRIREERRDVGNRAEELHGKSGELTRRHAEVVTSSEKLQYDINRIEQEEDAVEKRISDIEDQISRADQDVREARTAAEKAKTATVQSETAVARREEQIREIEKELAAASEKLETLRAEHSRVMSRLESLEDLYQRFEGYLEGPRNVLIARREEKEFATEVRGAVADLVTVPPEYESAVEAVLGNAAQWIVTSSSSDARLCLDYLTNEEAGRATVFPLDGLDTLPEPREISADIMDAEHVTGRVSELVDCDDEYRGLIDRLLGDAVIVESLDAALAIRAGRPGQLLPTMVTLAGTVVGRFGTIYGGQTKSPGRGLVGRRAEMDELRRQVDELEHRVDTTHELRDNLRSNLEMKRDELNKSETELRGLAVREAEIRRDLSAKEDTAARLGKQVADEHAHRERLHEQKADTSKRQTEIDVRLNETEGERNELDEEIENVAREMRRLRELEEQSHGRITEAQLERAQSEHAVSSIQAEISRLDQLQKEIDERRDMRTRELERSRVTASQIAEEIHETEQKVTKSIAERDAAQEQLVAMENSRHETLGSIEELDIKLKELRNNVQEAQSEVHALELDLTQQRDHLESVQERIDTEFDVRLADLTIEEVGTDSFTSEERDAEITRIRGRLGRMGTVNLMAIEEETEHEERYNFLVAQRKDLLEAKDTLIQIVEKFNTTTEQMFLKTFADVQHNFHDLFRSLMGGGQGKLSLVDEENVLDSGIAIAVRPPGKKMQSLELFSGGERALIAIALLFAIFKHKPSPFCILDEVDAPLDDANIGRFLDMLTEFTRRTQFTVITHNKITMERADVLYGVTMAERGVSQVISTRLADEDEADNTT